MTDDLPEITPEELRQRVLYSLMGAVVRLARVFEWPMGDLTKWLEVAYYHRLREEGKSQSAAGRLFDASRRKVARLAKKLKTNFLSPEREVELPRKIEFLLWAGELSEGRIMQSFDASNDEIEEALETLVKQDRVVRKDGRTTYYEVPSSEFRLYKDNWVARIDGLNHHLATTVDAIYARFFGDGDEEAFARTVNFQVRDDELHKLQQFYENELFPFLRELDDRAKAQIEQDGEDAETSEMSLGINWAPYQHCDRVIEDDE